MKVAGIDIGSSRAKAVILDDDTVYYSIKPLEDRWQTEAQEILNASLSKARLKAKDLDFVVTTGLVDEEWEGADDYLSEVSCAANGARYLFPLARTAIDMGAEGCRVTRFDEMSLECLRVLLNYETNSFKLLQLVLLGQMELHSKIMNIPNFLDRISFKYALNPLDLEETRNLIEFRIRQAGYTGRMTLFLDDAVAEIHRHTQGYPRKVGMLCHTALTRLIMNNRPVVDKWLIQDIVEEEEVLPAWAPTAPALLQKSSY